MKLFALALVAAIAAARADTTSGPFAFCGCKGTCTDGSLPCSAVVPMASADHCAKVISAGIAPGEACSSVCATANKMSHGAVSFSDCSGSFNPNANAAPKQQPRMTEAAFLAKWAPQMESAAFVEPVVAFRSVAAARPAALRATAAEKRRLQVGPPVNILQNTISDRTRCIAHSYGPDPHSC